MIGIILAAGRGTRMGTLTAQVPKPLLRVRGRPIIEHILGGFRSAGVRDVVIVTGYRGDQVRAFLGDGSPLGLRYTYRHQSEPTGTASALLLARDALGAEPFMLSWADILIERGEYAAAVAAFRATSADAVLVVNAVADPWRGAAVYVDEAWRVVRLVEKPPARTSATPWNNAGVFVFTPAILAYAERTVASPRGEYELPQAIAAMIDDNRVVRAHPLRGFWSDVGTPEDLAACERSFPA
jgi:dTDP-glucose pyrophosphorylase